MIKGIFIFAVTFYRKWISPLKRPTCRFYPTCSEYALQSLKKYPVGYAIILILKRISKCHPFHPGGYDPVK